jgi:uncharacterized protein (TIGR03067 family)
MNLPPELPGIWQAIAATINGEELPAREIDAIRLTLTATRFTTTRAGQSLFDSSYSIDRSATPMQIEMIGVEDFAGQPARGIYALEGDTLRLCYKTPGFPRPTEFTSQPGSGAFLIILKRLE